VTRPDPATARVELWIDGVPQMDWRGPIDDLDADFIHYPMEFPALGTWGSPISIRRFEALALTGSAHTWRKPPAGTAVPACLRVAEKSSLQETFAADAETDRLAAQRVIDLPNTKVGLLTCDPHGLTRLIEVRPGETLPVEPFRLDAVYLYGTSPADDDLAPLAAAKHLRSVQIAGSPVGDAGIRHLHGVPWRTLKLNANKITVAGLRGFTRLERCVDIDVGFVAMTHADVAELVSRAPRLHSLYLPKTGVVDGIVKILADLPDLQRLSLASNDGITDVTLRQLAALPRLSYVEIKNTGVTATGVAELRKALPGCNVVWDDSPAPAGTK
jgi:hypothetical protein